MSSYSTRSMTPPTLARARLMRLRRTLVRPISGWPARGQSANTAGRSGNDSSSAIASSTIPNPACLRARLSKHLRRAEFLRQTGHKRLCITEQHQRVVFVVKLVVDAGEARCHTALDDHDGARFVGIQNRHASDGAGGI